MTRKTQESGGISGCGGSFVPPSILEYAFVNVISGHGVPGTIVKLTDGGSLILGSATVASDASWSIPLDQPTKMYTVLRATAYNPTSEKTSAAAQVTVGGAQPEITESYAGSEGAVGMAARAARVTIYGPVLPSVKKPRLLRSVTGAKKAQRKSPPSFKFRRLKRIGLSSLNVTIWMRSSLGPGRTCTRKWRWQPCMQASTASVRHACVVI